MTDSQGKSNVIGRRKEIRDAFMLLVTDDDIKDITLDALDMARNPDVKPEQRLKAKEFIFKYLMPLPKQELDITSDGKGITGYTFKVVRPSDEQGN